MRVARNAFVILVALLMIANGLRSLYHVFGGKSVLYIVFALCSISLGFIYILEVLYKVKEEREESSEMQRGHW